ncbi:MAG TPA: N-acetylmuramoyl-L-alanine amidase [Chloroflexia bacterium]|nr:N-acetylmuramoyl-L-alanine amidase [Chloroflexia bacterium]
MFDRTTWQAIMAAIISILSFGLLAPSQTPALSGLAAPVPIAVQAVAAVPATARPFHVGVQIGHYKNSELPDALSRLVGSVGTSGGGRTEVDLNYDIANRVADLLQTQNVQVDLLPATVPTGYTADAFIAIHADGSTSSSPRGFKISTRWSSAVAVQDVSLVEKMTDAYAQTTKLPEDSNVTRNMRGYYAYASYRGNWRISALTPAAIVEMGYMSNAADRAVMFNRSDEVAAGIVSGVMDFLKSAYGEQPTTRNYGYGYGLVDKNINPSATPVPNRPPGSGSSPGGGSRVTTGNWRVVLFGRAQISVYSDAGSGTLVARVARDQVLKATVRKGDYYFVTLPDGRTGWVSRNSVVVQN